MGAVNHSIMIIKDNPCDGRIPSHTCLGESHESMYQNPCFGIVLLGEDLFGVEFIFKVQVVNEEQLTRRHRSVQLEESRPTFIIPQAQSQSQPQPMEQREMNTNSPEGPAKVETFRREQPKVGRNDPCPCGSGRKYKKCCKRMGSR